jgi:hypothetical protein
MRSEPGWLNATECAPKLSPGQFLPALDSGCSIQFTRAVGIIGSRKSIGSNFGCTLRCEFFSHSFSQSSSDGTVTSACYEQGSCEVYNRRRNSAGLTIGMP